MKTAHEIYMDIQEKECPNVNNLTLPDEWQIKAMQEYANQKLDLAAKSAQILDVKNNDHWYEIWPFPEVNKKSILKLKDKL